MIYNKLSRRLATPNRLADILEAKRVRATLDEIPQGEPQPLVLGSPVRSGFSSIFDETGTETGPPFLKYSKTGTGTIKDRSTTVLCGFMRSQDRSEPVTVQTSL